MNYYDPYKVLQVQYTDNLNTIREAFKQMALLHHPDRGGNPHMFDMCKTAYTDIYKFKIQQEKQLNQENRSLQSIKQSRQSNPLDDIKLNKQEQKMLEKNFNRVFEKVRIETPNDIGYGHVMTQSSKTREDKPTLSPSQQFNKRQLVVYEEPQPLVTLTENYEELGEQKIKDFSKKYSGGTEYTDYLLAHSEQDPITTMKNVRNKNYKSVDELRRDRDNISYNMSPEEQHKYELRKKQEEAMEQQRQMAFFQHKQNVEKKFSQIHNYLTY